MAMAWRKRSSCNRALATVSSPSFLDPAGVQLGHQRRQAKMPAATSCWPVSTMSRYCTSEWWNGIHHLLHQPRRFEPTRLRHRLHISGTVGRPDQARTGVTHRWGCSTPLTVRAGRSPSKPRWWWSKRPRATSHSPPTSTAKSAWAMVGSWRVRVSVCSGNTPHQHTHAKHVVGVETAAVGRNGGRSGHGHTEKRIKKVTATRWPR